MNKIIGLMTAWGVEDWIRPAVKQALEYCDEVLAVVSAFAPQLRRFEDKTYDICKEYDGLKLLDYESKETFIRSAIADVLNHMLKNSDLRQVGNWVWILDSDEFYTESSAKEIIAATRDSMDYDKIVMESRFFMINMQHYLHEAGDRMFRITDMSDRFVPTCKWSRMPRKPYVVRRDNGLFHYSMLTNTQRHRERWLLRYRHPHDQSRFKIEKWLDEIYAKYDLENEDYWIGKNFELLGIKSPWFNIGFTPDENGRLFKYAGRHPKFIEEAGLHKINDFRRDYYKNKDGRWLGGDNYSPKLNLQTIAILEKTITPDSLILETGSGNSTIWFAKRAKRVVSLESNIFWHNIVQGYLEKEGLQNVKIYVDPAYSQKSFKGVLKEEDIIQYDIVLLDGPNPEEARVPLLLEDAPDFVKPGGYLIVDDTHYEIFEPGINYLDSLGWEKTAVPMGEDRWGGLKEALIYRKSEGGPVT